MRSTKTKLLALLLAGAMVCVPTLAACDKPVDEPETTVAESEKETERPRRRLRRSRMQRRPRRRLRTLPRMFLRK